MFEEKPGTFFRAVFKSLRDECSMVVEFLLVTRVVGTG